MKTIKIKYVIAEGFRSFSERVETNVDRQGLNLVKGVNGAGKTTLFEIIVYCLYGTNLKGTPADMIPTWEEVRTEAFRGTFTEVVLDINGVTHSIVRTIGWSGGEGIGRDALVIRGQDQAGVHKKDVQAQIVALLGVDSQTFMSSILFGQRMPKLVETDNKDKRDLFERLFETAFINDAKAKAAEKIKELDGKCIEHEAEVSNKTTEITSTEQGIIEQDRMLSDFRITKDLRISELNDDIRNDEIEIAGYQANIDEAKEFIEQWDEAEFEKLTKEYDAIDNSYQDLKPKSEAMDAKRSTAQAEVGKASRADVVAETNVNTQKGRDAKWATDKAESIVLLKEELQELMNEKARRLTEVEDTCYACGQGLTAKSIAGVRLSIKETYDPQLEGINTKLEKKQAETMPESNLEELKKQFKATTKDLDSASEELKKVEAEHAQFQEDNKLITEQYNQMLKDEEELNENFGAVDKAGEDIKGWENDINVSQERLTLRKQSLGRQQKSEPPKFDYTVEDLQVKLGTLEVAKEDAQSAVDALVHEINLHTWWTKKGFASAGLPSFVFKAMLDNLNEYVKQYADRLGVSIEFSIDLTKASKPFTTICSVGTRMNKDYKEFSGGQKQRLDIVLIFAMHDLVSADSDINIMIMDEVFEGLDEAGEAAVFDLVRMKADEGKSIYVITHSPHIDSLYSSTITAVADETGATKIEG